ncbi:MAG: hypothetical protein QME78_08190, partial [Thermodesulfobacteriota bacterium]|nr:hypothetical protein [Thermodesulfobacteriota bacterium]
NDEGEAQRRRWTFYETINHKRLRIPQTESRSQEKNPHFLLFRKLLKSFFLAGNPFYHPAIIAKLSIVNDQWKKTLLRELLISN